jgi:uncharacterized protein (TIGR02996 family)
MNTNRWDFCRKIFANPLETTPRLVFADWLDENNMRKAAQRQREYCKLLTTVVLLMDHANTHEYTAIATSKPGHRRFLTIKKDGEINIGRHTLSLPTVRDFAIIYARWIADGKPNGEEHNMPQRISWIHQPLLLDACEAAGIRLSA